MAPDIHAQHATDQELADFAEHAFSRCAWDELIRAAAGVPFDAAGPRGRFFDAVCFALSQRKRVPEALALARRLQAAPNRMRNVSLAYVLYQALQSRRDVPGESREALKREFLAVSGRVLTDDPEHVTSLYRLATFFAEVESARDKKALELYMRAIRVYEAMDPLVRQRRHTFFKPYVKSLYGAARSALRLRQYALGQRLAGRCLRVDAESNHVAPVFKLYLAACLLLADGQAARAEKGFRLALAAEGPRDRDFIHDRLARALAAQRDLDGAVAWLDAHVPAHRRPAYVWTHLGDLELERGRRPAARQAWEAALRGNKSAKHLVLRRLGELALDDGKPAEARRRFQDALDWLRKRHQAVDPRLLEGLLRCAKAANDAPEAARLGVELARARRACPTHRREGGHHDVA
ncbi:MAG: tetratricopeptide repeat protein [Myxococcota bacterium]